MKEAEITEEKNSLLVKLTCEIDHHTAKRIREEVDRRFDLMKPSELILDFSGVGFMDSSGIGLIIGRAGRAEQSGAVVTVSGLSPALRKLVRMSGVEKLECIKVKGDLK